MGEVQARAKKYEEVVSSTRAFAERAHRAALSRHNIGPYLENDWELYSLWTVPDDDRIIYVLIDTLKNPYSWNPEDETRVSTSLYYEWEEVIAEMLSRSVRSNQRRIQMVRAELDDPVVRRVVAMALNHIQGAGREGLISDLMARVPLMDEDELDALIEDRFFRASDRLIQIQKILKQVPQYRPYLDYLSDMLPQLYKEMPPRVPNPMFPTTGS